MYDEILKGNYKAPEGGGDRAGAGDKKPEQSSTSGETTTEESSDADADEAAFINDADADEVMDLDSGHDEM